MVLALIAAVLCAGFAEGRYRGTAKLAVEARRREHRAIRDMKVWQAKLLERAGLGLLQPVVTQPIEYAPAKRFVSASQAIAEMHKEAMVPQGRAPMPVPPAIRQSFLNQGTTPWKSMEVSRMTSADADLPGDHSKTNKEN